MKESLPITPISYKEVHHKIDKQHKDQLIIENIIEKDMIIIIYEYFIEINGTKS